jgi:hypothetical protein
MESLKISPTIKIALWAFMVYVDVHILLVKESLLLVPPFLFFVAFLVKMHTKSKYYNIAFIVFSIMLVVSWGWLLFAYWFFSHLKIT